MTYQFCRLSAAGPDKLGLACTNDDLLLGQTPLIERRDGRFVVRGCDESNGFSNGSAISNKSIDLNAATYQRGSILLNRVNKSLDELTNWGGDKIEPSDITGKVLRVIIPRGSMTPVQREAIEAARVRALSKGLGFRVVEF